MTKAQTAVSETLVYCWNHCDNRAEEEALLWIAEHLSQALQTRFEFRDARVNRVHVIDMPNRVIGNYPLVPPVEDGMALTTQGGR